MQRIIIEIWVLELHWLVALESNTQKHLANMDI